MKPVEIAKNIYDVGLNDQGIRVRPMYLRKFHRSDVMTEVLDAKAVKAINEQVPA